MSNDCRRDDDSFSTAPRCTEVADKLVQLFGWRQTYKVEKRQRSLANSLARTYKERQNSLRNNDNNNSEKVVSGLRNGDNENTDKHVDSWVVVHNVQSHDGGILDPDDRVKDVVDDREQIVAVYEDGEGMHHGGGDGASGSSVGTSSPDIFQGDQRFQTVPQTDIEVTGEQIASGLAAPLQVRRGSEPALNQIVPGTAGTPVNNVNNGRDSSGGSNTLNVPDPSKRWSATPIIMDDANEGHTGRKDGVGGKLGNGYSSKYHHKDSREREEEDTSTFTRFNRDGSSRLSMQFLGDHPGGYQWADAAERLAVAAMNGHRVQSKSLPREHRRKEPLGQANSNQLPPRIESDGSESQYGHAEYIIIRNESGPLGIHVVPQYDRLGKETGIIIQGIEPGGRIDRDGRLAIFDKIIEINGKKLIDLPFHKVQEIFKDSLSYPELRLRVVRHGSFAGHSGKKPPPPVYPRSHARMPDDKENSNMVEGEEKLSHTAKVATVSPTKKVSPVHPAARGAGSSLLIANTRKIGKKIEIELIKGTHGLGFSITTRDNPAGGNCPIYIKNILPKGAAVEDGRLRPGDRLLEVNGVEMTGKTQAEAVAVLRNAPPGSTVRIVVSRQEESVSPKLPRQIVGPGQKSDLLNDSNSSAKSKLNGLQETHTSSAPSQEPPEQVNDDSLVFPWKHREVLNFNIPVHDTEKAGLGISVKGKTTSSHNNNSNGSSGSVDLGIFIKSVINGGAASRDGRLRTNDQLLNVNGISLLGQSNSDAMETLRRAMLRTEGPIPGLISLTIARRAHSPAPGGHNTSDSRSVSGISEPDSSSERRSENSTQDNSGTSSDNTVIFQPYAIKNDDSMNSSSRSIKSLNHTSSSDDKHLESRNPVIERLTGNVNQNPFRNESYFRATRETWNTSIPINSPNDRLTSPTINRPSGETVIVEEEYVPPHMASYPHQRINKPVDMQQFRQTHSTTTPSDKSTSSHGADATYASQLSLEEQQDAFSRDAFGRQSMSEKRHATLDAKNTDTYQRNKKLREERDKQRQLYMLQQQQKGFKGGREAKAVRDVIGLGLVRANSIESVISVARSQADSESENRLKKDIGPSLGMKKSSSLESLQTMVQEIQMQEDNDVYVYRNAQGVVRAVRGRGCNESFRAAVDRSYEAPLAELRSRIEMEPLAEEDGIVEFLPDERLPGGIVGFGSVRGAPRQSSLTDAKSKSGKKKPGLLRGIGSMFRFGKYRKALDIPIEESMKSEDINSDFLDEREAARRAAQEEQNRIKEQYKRFMQVQQQQQQQQQRQLENQQNYNQLQDHRFNHGGHMPNGGIPPPVHPLGGQSRTERIHQLRAQHQQKHVERRGQYPLDDREEKYEEVIRQRLEQPEYSHGRSNSYDIFGEMARPGSRVGITDPDKYSHYVNYEEIQQHLNRRQQHYHSQRRDSRDAQQRPVSNFYEYESVQALVRSSRQGSVPVDSNSNSLPRRINQDVPENKNNYKSNNNYIKLQQQQHTPTGKVPPSIPPVKMNGNNISSVNNSHRRTSTTSTTHHQESRSSHVVMHAVPVKNENLNHRTHGSGGKTRGPFITHVTINQQPHLQPSSKM